MKYKFIYDEDFIDNSYIELSEEEAKIVLITLAGGHNIMLTGYKTDRLVKAISLLRDMNKPFVDVGTDCTLEELIGTCAEDGAHQGLVTDADGGFLHTVNLANTGCGATERLATVMRNGCTTLCRGEMSAELPAKFQLIAETDMFCINTEFTHVLDKCDIKYTCKESSKRELYSVSKLKHDLKRVLENHYENVNSNKILVPCNKDINSVEQVFLTKLGYEMLHSCNYNIKTLRVARTIADMYGHIHTFSTDIEEAMMYS